MELEKDIILIVDRAYIKYTWFYKIHQNGSFWVTRAKKNMQYRILRNPETKLPDLSTRAKKKGLLKDQVIRVAGNKASDLPIELRLVVYKDPETNKVYEFIATIFHLSALTIAQIYQARWQIELFFRWIKQHLKIKPGLQ